MELYPYHSFSGPQLVSLKHKRLTWKVSKHAKSHRIIFLFFLMWRLKSWLLRDHKVSLKGVKVVIVLVLFKDSVWSERYLNFSPKYKPYLCHEGITLAMRFQFDNTWTKKCGPSRWRFWCRWCWIPLVVTCQNSWRCSGGGGHSPLGVRVVDLWGWWWHCKWQLISSSIRVQGRLTFVIGEGLSWRGPVNEETDRSWWDWDWWSTEHCTCFKLYLLEGLTPKKKKTWTTSYRLN